MSCKYFPLLSLAQLLCFNLLFSVFTNDQSTVLYFALQGIIRVVLLALQGIFIRIPHYTYTFIPNKTEAPPCTPFIRVLVFVLQGIMRVLSFALQGIMRVLFFALQGIRFITMSHFTYTFFPNQTEVPPCTPPLLPPERESENEVRFVFRILSPGLDARC